MTGRQLLILVVSFSLTMAVLVTGLLVFEAPASSATPASPVVIASAPPTVSSRLIPTRGPAPTPTASAVVSIAATPVPMPSTAPSASVDPAATIPALRTATPTSVVPSASTSGDETARTVIVTVLGADYVSADVPQNGTVTKLPDGSVRLETTRMYSFPMVLTYELPPEMLPAGTRILAIQGTRVCGSASGDFWESYGPDGSDPTEHEFGPPQPDGCWHYGPAPGPDTTVTVGQRTQTVYIISKIEYTVTIGP